MIWGAGHMAAAQGITAIATVTASHMPGDEFARASLEITGESVKRFEYAIDSLPDAAAVYALARTLARDAVLRRADCIAYCTPIGQRRNEP